MHHRASASLTKLNLHLPSVWWPVCITGVLRLLATLCVVLYASYCACTCTCACVCVCVCACARACVCGCVGACVRAWVHTWVRGCVFAWVRMCVCVCVCAFAPEAEALLFKNLDHAHCIVSSRWRVDRCLNNLAFTCLPALRTDQGTKG